MGIKIIKMINGEELLADQSSENTFKKIRVFHLGPEGKGGLMPWMMLAPDAEVEILSGICAITEPSMDVEKSYISATSSLILG